VYAENKEDRKTRKTGEKNSEKEKPEQCSHPM
jgi:hypothetical protein